MEQINEMIESQDCIGTEIAEIYRTFQKNGKLLNNLDYLSKWHRILDIKWTQFSINHCELRCQGVKLRNEVYFKEHYFEFIKLFYDQISTTIKLQERLVRIQQNLPLNDRNEADTFESKGDEYDSDEEMDENRYCDFGCEQKSIIKPHKSKQNDAMRRITLNMREYLIAIKSRHTRH